MERNIDKLVKVLEQSGDTLGVMMGFKMNYKPQSLKKMEEAIITMFGGRELRGETITMMGAYLGETIRRNVKGAEWVDFKEYVNEAYLVIPTDDGELNVNPFARIEKFSLDHTDTLYGFYAMIQDMKNKRLPGGEEMAKADGTFEGRSPRGYEYKVTPVQIPDDIKAQYDRGEITKEEMVRIVKEQHDAKKDK